MFRFLFGNKRSASPARASFRPQLEILEGRDLPSGFVPVSQDLAPQNLFQSPAHNQVQGQPIQVQQGPIQVQPISIGMSMQTLESVGLAGSLSQSARSVVLTKAEIEPWIQVARNLSILGAPQQVIDAKVAQTSAWLHPFDDLSLKGATVPHVTLSVDKLKTTPPPSTEKTTPPPSTTSTDVDHTLGRKTSIDPTWITQFLTDKYDKTGTPEQLKGAFQRDFKSLSQDAAQIFHHVETTLSRNDSLNHWADTHGVDSFGL